jgi:predicted lipoprotein
LRNFLVQGEGKVTEIRENEVLLSLNNTEPEQIIHLATEFIYGNAIRDAAGLFDIKNFSNSNDINSIAAEINRIIRNEVIPPFRKQVKVGDTVQFIGALELNQARLNIQQLEILPIQLSLK